MSTKPTSNDCCSCKNADIPKFNLFIEKYDSYFRDQQIITTHFKLDPMGQRDTDQMHLNKKKLIKLYGNAFKLYEHSCRFLVQQLKTDYSEFMIIKLE